MKKRKFSQHMLVHYLLAASSFGAVLFLSKSFFWATLSSLVGIFLDADHLVDYWLANGFNLDHKRFVRETFEDGAYFVKSQKIIVPFHSWEFLLLVVAVSWAVDLPRLGISFALGFIPHLLWDQITYAKRPLMYFFIFRAFQKFDLKKVCGKEY